MSILGQSILSDFKLFKLLNIEKKWSFYVLAYYLNDKYIFQINHSPYTFSRYGNFEDFLTQIEKVEGGLDNFSSGYKQFGPQVLF